MSSYIWFSNREKYGGIIQREIEFGTDFIWGGVPHMFSVRYETS